MLQSGIRHAAQIGQEAEFGRAGNQFEGYLQKLSRQAFDVV